MPGNCGSKAILDHSGSSSMQPNQPASPDLATLMAARPNLLDDMHPALKAEHIDGSPPALVDRALSMPFLQGLADGGSGGWPGG